MFELFAIPPQVMGARGDRYLWEAMRNYFHQKGTCLPNPDGDELRNLFESVFTELTERSINEREWFYIEKYAHGGMSSGYIEPKFWRDEGFEYLRNAYYQAVEADLNYESDSE